MAHNYLPNVLFVSVSWLVYTSHSIPYCYPIPPTLLNVFQTYILTFALPLVSLGWYLHNALVYDGKVMNPIFREVSA